MSLYWRYCLRALLHHGDCCSSLVSRKHSSEYGILWDIFRSQIANLWFPYDRTIAIDRSWSQTIADNCGRSQKIEHGSIFCDRLRSWSQDRKRSQTIAERFAICDLRSAMHDRLRSYGNQALAVMSKGQKGVSNAWTCWLQTNFKQLNNWMTFICCDS